jgi:Flp pilus assembly pilin Flp
VGNLMKRFVVEEEGMELLEWAIVAVLFALVAGAVFATLGTTVSSALTDVNTKAFQPGSGS